MGYLVTTVTARDRDADSQLTITFASPTRAFNPSGIEVNDPTLFEVSKANAGLGWHCYVLMLVKIRCESLYDCRDFVWLCMCVCVFIVPVHVCLCGVCLFIVPVHVCACACRHAGMHACVIVYCACVCVYCACVCAYVCVCVRVCVCVCVVLIVPVYMFCVCLY